MSEPAKSKFEFPNHFWRLWDLLDLSPLVSADFEEHVVPDLVRVRGPHLTDAAHRPVHEVVEILDWEKRIWL